MSIFTQQAMDRPEDNLYYDNGQPRWPVGALPQLPVQQAPPPDHFITMSPYPAAAPAQNQAAPNITGLLSSLSGGSSAGLGGMGSYQTGITAAPIGQAQINQYGAAMNPVRPQTDWTKITPGVSPQASSALNTQQSDMARAAGLSNQSEYYRQAAQGQAAAQNQFNSAQANDVATGNNNLLGTYRNNMNADLNQQGLKMQLTSLLTRLAGAP